jgi:hypothetical protein
MKPEKQPISMKQMRELHAYRVVEVRDDSKELVEIGDIVVLVPGGLYPGCVLNATKQRLFVPKDGHHPAFTCERAHDVKSISILQDYDDR